MKYLDEFRNPEKVKTLLQAITDITTRPWNIMEICGGQTHSFLRYGLDELLPSQITLLHGPGCPVCVTSMEKIDKAIQLALMDDVILCSFGDMLRVPGSETDLLSAKSQGAHVQIVYSPMDALAVAEKNPANKVVFFAVGFETTIPAIALTLHEAKNKNVDNFFALVSHVLVPPAMEALLSDPENKIGGFLAAGHVCTVMGYEQYIPLAEKYKLPIVVTGFEPVDLLQGIYACVQQLETNQHTVENQYKRSVIKEGNKIAIQFMEDYFDVVDQNWRGIGTIPMSGLTLKPALNRFDAESHFQLKETYDRVPSGCISGLVLQGKKNPNDCPQFGLKCTPEFPVGATMVSSEGACSAYYRYKKLK